MEKLAPPPGFEPLIAQSVSNGYNDYAIFARSTADKVKCTLAQALRLCTGRRAQRGSRGIALPFHVHGTRRG